jgi:peptide/nickel transport system permease protein
MKTALALFLILLLTAAAGPLLWKSDPFKTDLMGRLLTPNRVHPMGTDGSGRDLLARFIYGTRISLLSGVLVVLSSGIMGMTLGLFAARFHGPVDTVIMRLLDILLAFPQLILAMAITICLGPSLISACIGISFGCATCLRPSHAKRGNANSTQTLCPFRPASWI